jgi:DNA-binding CsgD family transcriptional regulator
MIKQAILNSLSERERQILLLIANGSQNQEIAQGLCISPDTVKNHKENLKRKLGMSTTTELYMASSSIKAWLEENGGGLTF